MTFAASDLPLVPGMQTGLDRTDSEPSVHGATKLVKDQIWQSRPQIEKHEPEQRR
jgi:hypothetical protein